MTYETTLENTNWTFAAFVSAGTATPAASGAEITLAFAAANDALQLSGSGGCNRYVAPCALSGQAMSVGLIAATRMLCLDPTMDQETRYLQSLETAQRWEIQGDRLVIFTRDGELHFERAAA